MELNYQQILAKQYDENNAKNQFVYEQEYEEEDVDEHNAGREDDKEVVDEEEFNRFQPRHQLANITAPQKAFEDKTKLSYNHEKDVKTYVFNIDSRFRDYSLTSNRVNSAFYTGNINPNADIDSFAPSISSHFMFRLGRMVKNAVSVKLTTIELPNVFYTFSAAYQNIVLLLTVTGTGITYIITIPEGNYSTPQLFASAIQSSITLQVPNFTVSYDVIKNKITIANTTPVIFALNFTTTITTPFNNGLGYNMGFNLLTYSGQTSYTAERVPDIIGTPYVYLALNDWNVVEHQSFSQQHFIAFAKILLTGDKPTIQFDTATSNTVTKKYNFLQPTNIELIEIKLIDPYGNILDMQGANFSMSIEIEEVLNMALYEKYRGE